jgi:hypothetical protein
MKSFLPGQLGNREFKHHNYLQIARPETILIGAAAHGRKQTHRWTKRPPIEAAFALCEQLTLSTRERYAAKLA